MICAICSSGLVHLYCESDPLTHTAHHPTYPSTKHTRNNINNSKYSLPGDEEEEKKTTTTISPSHTFPCTIRFTPVTPFCERVRHHSHFLCFPIRLVYRLAIFFAGGLSLPLQLPFSYLTPSPRTRHIVVTSPVRPTFLFGPHLAPFRHTSTLRTHTHTHTHTHLLSNCP